MSEYDQDNPRLGMDPVTLRDLFAGFALAGITSQWQEMDKEGYQWADAATMAYEQADHMLQERKKPIRK